MLARTDFDWRPVGLVMLFAVFLALFNLERAANLAMVGNDDLMRLQQIRDLVAGSSWWDTHQDRFSTGVAANIHWSRLPDLGPAVLIWGLSPVLGTDLAERIAVAFWPTLLLLATLTGVSVAGRNLGLGGRAVAVATFILVVSSPAIQFAPGRIDHHGLLICLMIWVIVALTAPRASLASGLGAGALVALALGTAIEPLPYAAMAIAGAGLFWVARGEREAPRLAGFGIALAAGALLVFLFDAPGPGAARATCDAFGRFHVSGLVAGGLGLALLARFGQGLNGPAVRLAAGGAAGLAAALAAVLADPACLGSPYGAVDDATRQQWMGKVGEAKPVLDQWSSNWPASLHRYGLILLGLVGLAWVWKRAPGPTQAGWLLVAGLVVAALGVSLWQTRGASFGIAFASLALGAAAEAALRRPRPEGVIPVIVLFVAIALLVFPTAWQRLVPENDGTPDAPSAVAEKVDCSDPANFATLADLPAGRVMSPVDLGPNILVHTPHTILAAPYHRNGEAIIASIETFRAKPDAAEARVRDRSADYLAICFHQPEVESHVVAAPEGLAAALQAGEVPGWLSRVAEPTESPGNAAAVAVYRVRPDADSP